MRASAHDPAGDRPHRAPGDPHQLDHRRLRAVRHQPGDLIVERSGVPGAVTGPRHRRHRHPMVGAGHPWRVGLDEHPHRAGIQRPPPPSSLTLVIAAATPIAAPAATPRASAEPARHDDLAGVLVELDGLDHHVAFDADHPRPYPLRLHPVALALFPAVDSRKAKPDNGVHPRMLSYSPTERDEEPDICWFIGRVPQLTGVEGSSSADGGCQTHRHLTSHSRLSSTNTAPVR